MVNRNSDGESQTKTNPHTDKRRIESPPACQDRGCTDLAKPRMATRTLNPYPALPRKPTHLPLIKIDLHRLRLA